MAELADFMFEAGDLGVARVGDLACGTGLGEAPFEVVFEVGVGAVEGGAGDPGGGREGLDVASAARGQVAAQELVGGGADAGLGLLALLVCERHVSPSWWRRNRSAGARAGCGHVLAAGGSSRRGGRGRGRRERCGAVCPDVPGRRVRWQIKTVVIS